MEIILLETLNKIGNAGEIVSVKDGFAKNFLIPQKKAIIANKKNKNELDLRMSQINENNEKKLKEADIAKNSLDGKNITIEMEANEDGNLYGNVNQRLLLDEINKKFSIELSTENLITGAIKVLGEHNIDIRLYGGVSAKLKLSITKKN